MLKPSGYLQVFFLLILAYLVLAHGKNAVAILRQLGTTVNANARTLQGR